MRPLYCGFVLSPSQTFLRWVFEYSTSWKLIKLPLAAFSQNPLAQYGRIAKEILKYLREVKASFSI